MTSSKNKPIKISKDDLSEMIYEVRGQKVMLDADLARVYGVTTKRLNEQIKRNKDRFPDDFAFRLTAREMEEMGSQIATASTEGSAMRSQIATASKRNIRYLPYAFTEHGAIMAANVLNSGDAIRMSVFVIRAFVKMREQLATNAAILKRLVEIDNTLLVHDAALHDLYRKLLPLLSPPPPSKRKQIGFHVKERSGQYRTRRTVPARAA